MSVTEEDTNFSITEMPTKASMKLAEHIIKEYTPGKAVRYMMENGRMEPNQDTASGKEHTVKAILDNGKAVKLKDSEFMYGVTGISMKVNGTAVCATGMAQISSPTVMFM